LAKIIGSANPKNVVIATLNGLNDMTNPQYVANKRGLSKISTGRSIDKGEKNG